jgi:hypothetical protein
MERNRHSGPSLPLLALPPLSQSPPHSSPSPTPPLPLPSVSSLPLAEYQLVDGNRSILSHKNTLTVIEAVTWQKVGALLARPLREIPFFVSVVGNSLQLLSLFSSMLPFFFLFRTLFRIQRPSLSFIITSLTMT